jgi:hypothetical protein
MILMIRRMTAFLFVTFLIIAAPVSTFAQGGFKQIVPANCSGPNAATTCGFCDLAELAQNVLNDAVYLAVFFSAIMFAWAGFKMLTNNGNAGQVSEARKIFTDVAVGLVIILVGWLVVDTLMRILVGGQIGGLPWNRICR